MGRISVRFNFSALDDDGAPVPVSVWDAYSAIVYQQAVTLNGGDLEKDFAPGTYLVRVALPSGEHLAQTVEVRDVDVEAVFRTSHPSPRESLGWAYYLQPGARRQLLTSGETGRLPYTFSGIAAAAPIVHFWKQTGDRWMPIAMGGDEAPGEFRVSYDTQIAGERPGAHLVVDLEPLRDWRDLRRIWAQVEFYPYSRIIAVPPSRRMRLFVVSADPAGKDPAPRRVLVGGGEPAAQALLGFLTAGDFESARGIGRDWARRAETALQQKAADPFSAAVAAYYLLRAGELDRLHDWTLNLAELFPWLADGAVIRAWHLLHDESPDPKQVRAWLLEGVRRGLPLCAQGLRLLYDGLGLLERQSEEADSEVHAALEWLQPYAAAALWNSPVTCFGGVDPEQPVLHPEGEFNALPALSR